MLSVGGYCETFLGWGGEDSDVKWKLMSVANSCSLFNNTEIALVHVNHEKPYYSKLQYENNKKISEERQKNNVANAIYQDVFRTDSLLTQFIKTSYRITNNEDFS